MRIDEIFSSDVPFEIVKDTPTEFSTRAKVNDRLIKFTATLKGSSWLIFFVEQDPGGDIRYDTTTATGHGGELKVFSMVWNSLKQFIEKNQPEKMDFASAGNNRSNLYKRMLNRLPGYGYTAIPSSQPGITGFKITKKTN